MLNERLVREISQLDVCEQTRLSLKRAIFGKLAFYTYLPLDILNAVSKPSYYLEKTLDLSVASCFYLASLIVFDKVLDNQVESVKDSRQIVDYLFFIKEYSIKKLQSLLGDNREFWDVFQSLKRTLFFSSSVTNIDFCGDENQLKEILINKSSLIKLYVVSMKLIVSEEIDWAGVSKALETFHVAFQMLDDYEDLKEDFKMGQLNYYWALGKSDSSMAMEPQIKKLILEGVIERGLIIGQKNANIASKTFCSFNMVHSMDVAHALALQISAMLTDIRLVKIKAKEKVRFSNIYFKNNNLENALFMASSFIFNHQESDASWMDFLTLAGNGHNWVTAFVVSMLAEFKENHANLRKSIVWLQNVGGMYNQNVFTDADSMNFYLMSKFLMGERILDEELNQWLFFMHGSGGFSTYVGNSIKKVIHASELTNIDGWVMEHNCVTAVACWVAHKLGYEHIYVKTHSFLSTKIDEDGKLSSYWWSDDFYAMSFAVLAGLRGKTLDCLLHAQQLTGNWCSQDKPSVFYTALALKAIESVYLDSRSMQLKARITKGIKWLVEQQCDDGSWKSEYILKIPRPSLTSVDNSSGYKKSSFGFGIITDDYKRVFTTALVYNVLKIFKENVQ